MFNNIRYSLIDKHSKEYASFQNIRNKWPYQIKSIDNIPDPYKDVFPSYPKAFPYTILIPDENYSFFKKKGFLIIVIGDKLHILEKLGSEINAISFDKQEISYIVSGTALLHSWITITGENRSYTFSFNSIMDYIFLPIIKKFRNIKELSDESDQNEKKYLFFESNNEQLRNNIKFKNLMRNHFIKGNRIDNIIFQPSCLFNFKQFPLFKLKFFKRYITNHLIILTNQELIFIQESKIIQKKIEISYDYVYTFVNKKNIDAYEIKNGEEDNLKCLLITLKNGTRLSTYFSQDNQYLYSFVSGLSKNTGKGLKTDL